MKKLINRLMLAAIATSLIATFTAASAKPARAQHPSWINSAVIYSVYPRIFSSGGNFAGVTAN